MAGEGQQRRQSARGRGLFRMDPGTRIGLPRRTREMGTNDEMLKLVAGELMMEPAGYVVGCLAQPCYLGCCEARRRTEPQRIS